MPLLKPTKDLLSFLSKNPAVRAQIAAPSNATVLYAGNFIRPVWRDLDALKQSNPAFAQKKMLPDVLATIRTPSGPFPNLLEWTKSIDSLQPWKENGFIAWRAVSGIYAANAKGAVSFCIGSGITKNDKVFAATELAVLLRNPNIDSLTKDILGYFERCLKHGQSAINFGFIAG